MVENIYLRPLQVQDAAISFQWRNDQSIWLYTGKRPDCIVTAAMEEDWARKVLQDSSRVNYAICLKEGDKYIGNIYLVNIKEGRGELGIFIGDKQAHGKGYGKLALNCLKKVAKECLSLREILIRVRNENIPAVKTYLGCGAEEISSDKDGWLTYLIRL